jgi:hypothetical protein
MTTLRAWEKLMNALLGNERVAAADVDCQIESLQQAGMLKLEQR